MEYKICSKCKSTKEVSSFSNKKQKVGEYYSACKECLNKIAKAFYQKNIEKQREIARLRAAENRRSEGLPEQFILTKEEFIKRSVSSHPNTKFDYADSTISGSVGNTNIKCEKGHAFSQLINVHMRGGECPFCNHSRMNSESFVEAAEVLHGKGMFDYSEFHYISSNVKGIINCSKGHRFSQTPNNHLSGKGCKQCATYAQSEKSRKTLEEFIKQSEVIHGKGFDYSKVTYKGDREKVELTCPVGHHFWQQAGNHSRGTGCPICKKSGYLANLPGYLYILGNGEITKIGITNRTPEIRAKEINKMKPGFKVIYSHYYQDGTIPLAIETALLWTLPLDYKRVEEKFDGSTECFIDVDREHLIYIAKNTGAAIEGNK
jgi:hypothetical protein